MFIQFSDNSLIHILAVNSKQCWLNNVDKISLLNVSRLPIGQLCL